MSMYALLCYYNVLFKVAYKINLFKNLNALHMAHASMLDLYIYMFIDVISIFY